MKNKATYHILVMRFSSLGDVAMTVPVVREFLNQNPGVKIIFVSRGKFRPLFDGIERLEFHPADLEGVHNGFFGLYKLYKNLKKYEIDAVADLHNVLRTKTLCVFFRSVTNNIAVLNKGREERKALIRTENKIRKPLKTMPERYADVFRNLGFEFNLSHKLPENNSDRENAIGIAPFAMYPGKMYPVEKMRTIALKIAENGTKVYLFGGKDEAGELKSWEKLNPNIESVAGTHDLKGELELIKKLKLMVSMDSANMHLASMVGTRVISIWGNTHPFTGFLGYGQSMEDVIQDETLFQRPTSVFGKESKNIGNPDFFRNIQVSEIVEKIKSVSG